MDCHLDIFFLEAVLNGVLLAGLLALLALGLNLVFGVIDVVWICYAELVMVGMYGIHYSHKAGAPFLLAALIGILLVALAGALLHVLVIRPVLDQPPINQLLVTGGVLFFLQAAATMAFGIEFRNIGIRLGSVNLFDMSFAWSRILTFAVSLAGLAAALMVLQYDIYPQIGLQFGPLIFMICVLGGLGNMIGGFVAAFIIAEFIAVGGSCFATEWGYAVAFLFFMVVIFIRPQGLFGSRA